MKKMWSLAMISVVLLACNAEGSNKKNLDSLQNKVDSVAERWWMKNPQIKKLNYRRMQKHP